MKKFKVGDIVKVIKKDPVNGHNGWASDMDKYVKKTHYVTTALSDCCKLNNKWWFTNDILTHSKKKPTGYRYMELNNSYVAEIDPEEQLVRVGCQTFTFKKIHELAKLCKLKKSK